MYVNVFMYVFAGAYELEKKILFAFWYQKATTQRQGYYKFHKSQDSNQALSHVTFNFCTIAFCEHGLMNANCNNTMYTFLPGQKRGPRKGARTMNIVMSTCEKFMQTY